MCGIVGALSAAPIDVAVVARMRDQLAHRGPDHAGLWRAEDGHACLGHRRLAIIDPHPEANQPLLSHDGRYILTFNGEIYNYRALRAELEAQGARFRTRSDTEVLLEAYRAWGERCLERLSGMLAFAIWDTQERRLFCARDRAGEKPFYYAVVGQSFLFASELKSILEWPGLQRRLSHAALLDYLTYGFVPDPKCIWQGCAKLPPGHWMSVVQRGEDAPVASVPVQYWDMEFEPDERVADWGPLLRETLERAADEMAVADVPLGTFLSGGVDSSSVTAALRRTGHTPRTFTIGFPEESHDERRYAREVSEHCRTEHTERVVTRDDVAPVFERLLWHYDEPFNDYSYFPTYYLCREARRSITVALSGDGGDELFAGYLKYQRLGLRGDLARILPRPLTPLLAATAGHALPEANPLRRTLRQYALDDSAMLVDMMMTGFTPPVLRRAVRGPLAQTLSDYDPAEVVTTLLRRAPPREVGMVNAMRYLDLKLTLAGDILVKVDRASMAVSLEVRPVYLHRDLLALAGRIPPRLLAGRKHAKGVLKDALRPWLPESILYRRKMGFGMPLGRWIGANGDGPFAARPRPSALDELIDPTLLTRLTAMHASGKAEHASRIHSLHFLGRWLERWQ
ncbi:MAG TPA: asparagine synthase (glutamine-hydrolyzing) [Longimicrobiaceae bacterium]|nr:asparagine synthase (glutamine-hydrolyzing) [Longimicrobiaceae bacterium]